MRFRTDRSVGDGESAAEDDGGEDGGVDEDAVDGAGDELDECRGMESRRGDSISSKNSKKFHSMQMLHLYTPVTPYTLTHRGVESPTKKKK